MALRKDDPVYYKKKMIELLMQAKANGLEIKVKDNGTIFFKSRTKIPGMEIMNEECAMVIVSSFMDRK